MKLINLTATTDSAEIVLAGVVTANQLDRTCSYYDVTTATGVVLEGVYTGTTNSTTAVTVCAAPASGHIRTVKSVTVYNKDTASATPIIQFNANGTIRVMARTTLTTLGSWSTDDMSYLTDISGKVTGPASATDNDVAVFDSTTGKIIKDSGVLLSSKANLASPTFTGTVTLPTTQLGEASVKLDATLSGAGTWSGITIAGTGGETLAFGDLCYFKAADSLRWKAKGDVTATSGSVKLGMCVLAGASTTTEILLIGNIYISGLTAGLSYYASAATAGAITSTQPTGTTGFVVRKLGFADSSTQLYFNPSTDYAEI